MIWLAALLVAAACYLGAGAVVGRMPKVRAVRPGRSGLGSAHLWVAQSGVGLGLRQLVASSALAGAAAFTVIWTVTDAPLVALVPAAGAAGLPVAYCGRRRSLRLRRVQEAWPDGLRDLRASISAGRALPQALVALADGGPEPLQEALARLPELSRALGVVAALEIVKEELADPTSDRVVEVLVLAVERGGAVVADILDDLIVATTRDVKALEEIETDTLEMRINARAVLVLPWLVLVALTLRDGPFRAFYRSSAGVVVIVAGAALTGLGALLVGRLARLRPEPRVFGAASAHAAREAW